LLSVEQPTCNHHGVNRGDVCNLTQRLYPEYRFSAHLAM
jgi:hypothetical protein